MHHFIVARATSAACGKAARHAASAVTLRRWTVLRAGSEPIWYLVTIPEALSYTSRAASPMAAAPPAT